MKRVLVSVAFAALGLAACARSNATPAAALEAFGRAIERGDHAAAYRMMSDAYRARVPFAEFARPWRAGGPEATALGRRLRDDATAAAQRVDIPLAGGEDRARRARDKHGWWLETPPREPFGRRTPREALQSFIRAAETERFDVLLALAPERHRARLTVAGLATFWTGEQRAERRALLGALRLAMDGPIVEEGAEAFLVHGAGTQQVHFVREGDLWCVESPE